MEHDILEDISTIDLSNRVSVDNPIDYKGCMILRKSTPARICTGRAGSRYKTSDYLRLRADHAVAMDAVWSYVDESIVDELGFFKVQTLVKDKEEYITRPDLGRGFSKEVIESYKRKMYIKYRCTNNSWRWIKLSSYNFKFKRDISNDS